MAKKSAKDEWGIETWMRTRPDLFHRGRNWPVLVIFGAAALVLTGTAIWMATDYQAYLDTLNLDSGTLRNRTRNGLAALFGLPAVIVLIAMCAFVAIAAKRWRTVEGDHLVRLRSDRVVSGGQDLETIVRRMEAADPAVHKELRWEDTGDVVLHGALVKAEQVAWYAVARGDQVSRLVELRGVPWAAFARNHYGGGTAARADEVLKASGVTGATSGGASTDDPPPVAPPRQRDPFGPTGGPTTP